MPNWKLMKRIQKAQRKLREIGLGGRANVNRFIEYALYRCEARRKLRMLFIGDIKLREQNSREIKRKRYKFASRENAKKGRRQN